MTSRPITLSYRGRCRAELHTPLLESDILSWRSSWRPHFAELEARNGEPEPDAHWDWGLLRQRFDQPDHFTCAITADGATQAMMICSQQDSPPRRRGLPWRRESATLKPPALLYVEFIAAAPWNRGPPAGHYQTQYKTCAAHLIRTAVGHALSLELGGFGLHSLPSAESFYEGLGMTRVPEATKHGMSYFEFTPNAAKVFYHE
jgi:hypothetical protein